MNLPFSINPINERFEDVLSKKSLKKATQDIVSGLIVAVIAIPLAMGFAMASGLRPEQGIIAGAIASLVGSLFGGSKYQVYGPTAAFIPLLSAIMLEHGLAFLTVCSITAGVVLIALGIFGFGKYVSRVPHSIIVGFTIGISIVIALSQINAVVGLNIPPGNNNLEKILLVVDNFSNIKIPALIIAFLTFIIIFISIKISPIIPGPIIAIILAIKISEFCPEFKTLTIIKDQYGSIPKFSFNFTPPVQISIQLKDFISIIYYSAAIIFIAAIESLLCSRMADRLANNKGTAYNPNQELFGQGLVNIFVPLFNGFPCTGALARTATNIKLGASSPISGIANFLFTFLLASFFSQYLELVPISCIGGILLFVAYSMIKPQEIKEVREESNIAVLIMVFTALMVILTDFLFGVLSGILLYFVIKKFKGPWPLKNEGAVFIASVKKSFAPLTATSRLFPLASRAVIEAESAQPVP